MENLKIEATKYSPFVELSEDGHMIIRGRSIIEDPVTFYKQIIDWIPKCKSKTFSIEVQFDYLNTSSTKVFFDLLNKIKEHYNSTSITIAWYFEEDDIDMEELGKDIESLICVPIDFYEMAEKSV